MKEQREIKDEREFERTLADRVYLGTLILAGFVLGTIVVAVVIATIIKQYTGSWPNWL